MRKFQYLLVFFVVLLVMSLPIAFADQIKTVQTVEIRTPLFQTASEEAEEAQQSYDQMQHMYPLANNPAEECRDRSEKANDHFSSVMENGIMSTLEGVLSIMRLICTTMNTIDLTLVTIGQTVGLVGPDGSGCCELGIFLLTIPCEVNWGIYKSWEDFYTPVIKPLCCWFTCGWCTSGCWGFKSIFDGKEGAPDPSAKKYGLYGAGKDKSDSWLGSGGISAVGLSPYDNIYTAIACLCPGAILENLKKLNAIYKTYDCCVKEACSNGMSTEGCESMLDESTCMFWEGAMISSLAKIVTKLIMHAVFKYVALNDTTLLWMKCIMIIYEAIQLPQQIMAIVEEWSKVGDKFDSPDCKDLGFTNIRSDFSVINDQLLEQDMPLQLQDYDGDGYVDGYESDTPSGFTEQDLAYIQQQQMLQTRQAMSQWRKQKLRSVQEDQQGTTTTTLAPS